MCSKVKTCFKLPLSHVGSLLNIELKITVLAECIFDKLYVFEFYSHLCLNE